MKMIRRDQVLWLAVVGNTYFFFVGGLLQFTIYLWARRVAYSFDAGRFPSSGKWQSVSALAALPRDISRAENRVRINSSGLSGHDCPRNFVSRSPDLSFRAVLLLLAALGFFGGFFIVAHQRPDPAPAGGRQEGRRHRHGELAFFLWALAPLPVCITLATHFAHLSPGGIFFWSALATLGATAYVLWLLPDSLLRLLLWIATNTLYRLDVAGRENVPARGGALLTPITSPWLMPCFLSPRSIVRFASLCSRAPTNTRS